MNPQDLDILAIRIADRLTMKRWLKLPAAVEYAGINRTAMVSLLREGEIKGYQRNERGDWIVDRESIDAYHLSRMQVDYEGEARAAMERLGVG
jgi:hypothetical protein